MENKKKPVKIEIDEKIINGQYVNTFIVNFSENEFILDFAFQAPGLQKIKITNRMIVTPRQMSKFIDVSYESLKKYEENYGKIKETSKKTLN
jgi:Protein of unknown function (DUF3467)